MRFSSEILVSSLRNHAEFDLSGKNISLILFLEDNEAVEKAVPKSEGIGDIAI